MSQQLSITATCLIERSTGSSCQGCAGVSNALKQLVCQLQGVSQQVSPPGAGNLSCGDRLNLMRPRMHGLTASITGSKVMCSCHTCCTAPLPELLLRALSSGPL